MCTCCACACTCMCMCIHTCGRTRAYMCMPAQVYLCACMHRVHAYVCILMHAHMYEHARACTCMHVHACRSVHACLRVCVRVCVRVCACVRACVRACTHGCVCVCVYACTCVWIAIRCRKTRYVSRMAHSSPSTMRHRNCSRAPASAADEYCSGWSTKFTITLNINQTYASTPLAPPLRVMFKVLLCEEVCSHVSLMALVGPKDYDCELIYRTGQCSQSRRNSNGPFPGFLRDL